MQTRLESFIERLISGSSIGEFNHNDDSLADISLKLKHAGHPELAKQVYALYCEAYLIHKELKK